MNLVSLGPQFGVDFSGANPKVKELLSRPEVQEQMARSVSLGRSQPDITAFDHVRSKKRLLYEWLSTKKKIYLDTCYWINILHARQKSRRSIPIYGPIADLLEDLRERDIVVCPASFPLVTEIFKQGDPVTRRQSAELIDKLSCGVCLQNPTRIIELEFINSFERLIFGDDISQDAYAYWTKIFFFAGEGLLKPKTQPVDPSKMRLLQKLTFDVNWEISFADLVNIIGNFSPPLDHLAQWAHERNHNRINEGRKSFAEARTEEMASILNQVMPLLRDVFDYIQERCRRSGKRKEDVPTPRPDPTFAPSIQILGNAFAVMRSSPRRYDPNDYIDFEHGSLALPYCDAFFCDRRLFNILTEKPLELHRVYAAKISHKPEDVLAYLQNL